MYHEEGSGPTSRESSGGFRALETVREGPWPCSRLIRGAQGAELGFEADAV